MKRRIRGRQELEIGLDHVTQDSERRARRAHFRRPALQRKALPIVPSDHADGGIEQLRIDHI